MKEQIYSVKQGDIHYWVHKQEGHDQNAITLVFLPGLTADHRLFAKQIRYFKKHYNLLVWDAPGHYHSRPFELDFSLMDKAKWLHDILKRENIENPVLIGQSMGGYVSQCFMECYPGEASGFISIDSDPLQRQYVTAAEIWLLERMTPVYRMYPWQLLIWAGAKGCAETRYGRYLMQTMIRTYAKEDYCKLAGHGFKILAEAIKADLPYEIDCPALLLCGEHDHAGSTKRYNRQWTKETWIPLIWIEGAGHNANTDQPEKINQIIVDFLERMN